MPANNTGTIQIGTPVVALTAYDYSKQDTAAWLSQIPVNGTELTLPVADTIMEAYEFGDVDGTCSLSHPITLVSQDGQHIQGESSIQFNTPFAWGRVVWSGTGWVVETGQGTSINDQPAANWAIGPTGTPAIADTGTEVAWTTIASGAAAGVNVPITPKVTGRVSVRAVVSINNPTGGAINAFVFVSVGGTPVVNGPSPTATVPAGGLVSIPFVYEITLPIGSTSDVELVVEGASAGLVFGPTGATTIELRELPFASG